MVNSQATTALQQYNTQLNTAVAGHRNVSTSIVGLNDSFNKFNQALNTTVLGFSAMDVVKFGVELNRLGQQVNIASRVFDALAGGTQEAAEMLELMQQKTGGVVDNMTLMAGASRLLQMGLASSKEEVAGLTEMAIKLGGALGMDANKAIEDFSLLLSNVSYLRLDQFGISAGAVRARVEELKEEFPELSREARFAKAVLEEGGDAMLRLGDAAGSASTAISRFETNVTNTMQRVGSNINKGVEGIFLFFEATAEEHERTVQRAIYLADQWNQIVNGFNPEHLTERTVANFQVINDAIMNLRINLERMPTVDEVMTEVGADGYADVQAITFALENQFDWDEMINNQLIDRQRYLENIARITEHMNSLGAEQATQEAEMLEMETRRAQQAHLMAMAAEQQREDREVREGMMNGLYGAQMDAAAGAGFFRQTPTGFEATQQYSDEATAYRLEQQALAAEAQVEAMQDMEDAMGEGFFSDEELDSAQQYADNIRGMADDARRMADALQDASLSDLFGQQGGGRTGEMSDDIIAQMEESGASQEEIDAARRAFDIGTGRETDSSLSYQEELVPIISEMAASDPQAALEAMQNFNEIMTLLAEQGIDPNSVDAVQHYIEAVNAGSAIDPDSKGDGGEGGDSAYDTSGLDPAAFVESLTEGAEPISEMASNFSSIKNDSEEFKTTMEIVAEQGSIAQGHMEEVARIIAEISGHPQPITLVPVIDGHQLHLQLSNEFAWWQMALR